MSRDHPMLHEKTEDMLLHKCRQRAEEFGKLRYWDARPIPKISMRTTIDYEKAPSLGRECNSLPNDGRWREIKAGDEWGGDGEFAWFRLKFAVPKEYAGKTLVAVLNLGGEGCIFVDGEPYQGADWNHQEVILADKAKAGQEYDLLVECVSSQVWQNQRHKVKLDRADIAVLNPPVRDYYYDLRLLLDIANCLPWGSRRRSTIIRTVNKSVDAFDPNAGSFDALAKSAEKAAKIIAPLYKNPAVASAIELACIGHSHIDTAWLWPYAETIRKCARTFSSVDRLMGEYPLYLFSQSQAQLYEFARQNYPGLYERLKKRVKEGRFEPMGSMWVEADCNICSGESLVRQILLGKTYFMEEFGVETKELWLPDVFGYSAAIPQILKKAGVDYFKTVKVNWSQFNQFPYTSFWWEGIDGTRVLAHVPPTGNYNGNMEVGQFRNHEENNRQKDRSDIMLYSYGHGDGGGGPDKNHLEVLKRAGNLEGIPKCTAMTVARFFKELEKRSEDLPTWVGELYLEYHRGTYTTQARNKRANRKSEFLLRDAEMVCGLAWMLKGAKYPHDQLTHAWKMVCKNQFHDVIPGTSVTDVYRDTAVDYQEIARIGEETRNSGLESVGAPYSTGSNILVFNSLSWDRSDAIDVKVPGKAKDWHVETADGQPVPSQPKSDNPSVLWFSPDCVPGIGMKSYKLVKGATTATRSSIKVSSSSLENDFYRIKLDKQGLITSIFDKRAGREVLPKGEKANVLQLFEDKPLAWDAWDIEFYYRDKGQDITDVEEITVEEAGPVRGTVKIRRKFGQSEIEQRIVLWASIPRIDFETHADWHEETKMLKVAFPVDIHANKARYEIQFGSAERATHENTSWDFARFEVAAQKWVDLSQSDYGVSLLNDCKYGHDIHGNVIRMTLLRSPKMPDPHADMGEHLFTYSLLPHAGALADGTVMRAYELNVPMVAWVSQGKPGFEGRLLSVDAPNVIVEAVKKAEKEDALVVRMYECTGGEAQARLEAGFPVSKATECDLLERTIAPLQVEGRSLSLTFKPFEIKTVKLVG